MYFSPTAALHAQHTFPIPLQYHINPACTASISFTSVRKTCSSLPPYSDTCTYITKEPVKKPTQAAVPVGHHHRAQTQLELASTGDGRAMHLIRALTCARSLRLQTASTCSWACWAGSPQSLPLCTCSSHHVLHTLLFAASVSGRVCAEPWSPLQ